MRDALIALAIMATMLWSLRSPWIGAVAWAVISLLSPHAEFGYAAASWPVATGIAACTILGTLFTKDRWNPLVGAPAIWLLVFTIWICITLPFSIFFEDSYPLWVRSMKIYLMIFVTLSVINTRRKLQVFIWANVAAVGYYGIKGGLFTIVTGGNYRVWGSGGFTEGNNEIALAVITVIPLMRYLQQQLPDARARWAMTGAMLLSMVMALGTYSRGALLGLVAMGLVFWWKGGNKALWATLMLVIVGVGLSFMPDKYWERMDTIKTYDADTSALGRINAWWMAFNLARDNFFGGGFMIYELPVFQRYAPDPNDVHAAHSIYFQVLGEHGFPGLLIFLAIGIATWWMSRGLVKAGRQVEAHRWAADLGSMIQVSMIGYGVTGAFLSLAYFDLPYNVLVAAVVAARLVALPSAAGVVAGASATAEDPGNTPLLR